MIKNLNLVSPIDLRRMKISERRDFLTRYMREHFVGHAYNAPALGGKKVRIVAKSVLETATHASKNFESTILAINLPQIIEKASFAYSSVPKCGTQTKKFHARRVIVLLAETEFGPLAKLTIVEKGNQFYLEYCVTAKENPMERIVFKINESLG